ncbi:MAG: SWIM zinc finger domain-containing protein [Mycobacteriales bacterium]
MAWFTEGDLRRLAGERSFSRGRAYVAAVADVRDVPGGTAATVQGTEAYQVRLGRDGDRLVGWCDCPFGADGAFCKHCVALGLVLLADADAVPAPPSGNDAGPVRPWLSSLDRDELVDLILNHAEEDEAFHRRLSIRAALARGQVDVVGLRRELTAALRSRGFVSYRGSFDYAGRAEDALDALDGLLRDGRAAVVEPLARRAVDLIVKATEQMDDSSGAAGSAGQRALDLHAEACRAAPPDRRKLARWLVDLQVDGPGWPQVDLAAYVPGLGDDGLAAYRALVDDRWRTVGGKDSSAFERRTVQHLREDLAGLSGDVDELVAVLADDLSSGWQYLRIAEELAVAGRYTDALTWAERGRRAHRDRPDPRLLDFLVTAYKGAGRREDAVEVRRSAFAAAPEIGTWIALRTVCEAAGCWPGEREDALAYLHERSGGPSGADSLVRVLVHEDDVDGAWQAAQERGCRPATWLELAERRAGSHPADAIPYYRKAAAEAIDGRSKAAYAEAADRIAAVRTLHARAGTPDEFTAWLDEVVSTHRAKRNFMAELARRGLVERTATGR